MSKYYGPFSVTPGALAPINTSQYPDVNVAVFVNESPYTLYVDPGTGSYYVISAFMQDAIVLGPYSGVLKVTAQADITFQGTPPVAVLYVQTYAKGEPVPGTYPAALARLMSVGNTVNIGGNVTSIKNIGETPPNAIITLQPAGYSFDTCDMDDVGNFKLTGNSNGIQQTLFQVSAGGGSGSYSKVQLDNGRVATDGQGNITNRGTDTGAVPGSITTHSLLTDLVPQLHTGNQESGRCGAGFSGQAVSSVDVIAVNFKTVMTNVPSSITLSVRASSNASGQAGSDITKTGFTLTWSVGVAGFSEMICDYTTVGN